MVTVLKVDTNSKMVLCFKITVLKSELMVVFLKEFYLLVKNIFIKSSFICPDEMASVSVCLSLFKKPQIFTSIKLVFLGSLD